MVKDYESGANRAGKFERDIRQLLEALEHEPENARYWFYLAQSYRDAGRIAEAAQTYAKRAALGGWDEEAWYARFQEARCLWAIGDECAFLGHALMAYNQRPHRAKSLYYLARFYRERGMHDASILFSEPALTLPWPEQDSLFIEDYIYNAGLLEEFSISANYSNNPLCKARGHAACNVLALSRQIPEQTRNLARSNLFFYVGPAITLMPSFRVHFIQFTPPDGYIAVNPSIAGCNDELVLWQRTINCIVTDDGSHATIEGFPVTARHFVLKLSQDFQILSSVEILPPPDLPLPTFPHFRGFEGPRIFSWRDELWCCASTRELGAGGRCRQLFAQFTDVDVGVGALGEWQVLSAIQQEEMWIPQVSGDILHFISSASW